MRYCFLVLFFLVSPLYGYSALVLGDSLSAAYLIPEDKGWVTLLQEKVKSEHPQWSVINASIVGDTTANGLQRLPDLLQRYHPELILIELGGNDGLRGLPITEIENNLSRLIELSQQAGAKVLLLGVRLPPNYGATYTQTFSQIYTALSQKYGIPLVPFLLENVALNRGYMQRDGIHPTEHAQPLILQNVWPHLKPLL